MLNDVLDVDLIMQEVEHNAFNPVGTFALIGEILKDHCAPMRDAAIDDMVAFAGRCSSGPKSEIVRAIRACFEILELMKLVRNLAYFSSSLLIPQLIIIIF
jgi:hypothetical protein